MPRNIRGRLCRVLDEIQIFGRMWLRHEGAILAARQAVTDPRRILMTRYANTTVERTAAQPTEQNVFVVELIAVPTLLFA